ncbi:16S rRNA (uracil(1498)-N(3))-methyltransferase [Pantoea sp. Aalb]|uniref:16S rRNA (uracil(1498)-N(3))-methyltransferase n=1 Tax=Pantoea sp. Aalb TaxID=2576762 RepID=UPI00132C7776|nr:16S rRNA (uracil(1498)-N(3))-methyltransferase [Pantoea sp. Aalb]MXP67723.1 16S rRNA (uracil(1498)-N(3))-methyltransferase [Pantoea sp. Aalb]
MRIPRIYHPHLLEINNEIILNKDNLHHLYNVLRMTLNQEVELFNGSNLNYSAKIIKINKKYIKVKILREYYSNLESPLYIHLGQVISRSEKMDFIIQKASELGVNVITPLFSKRCIIKLDRMKLLSKIKRWQKIAISACEQCGRNYIPQIREPMVLENWCSESDDSFKIHLHIKAIKSISKLPKSINNIRVLIGPEGGLSSAERVMAVQKGFINVLLGPRVLRMETATITAITALQVIFGDLG